MFSHHYKTIISLALIETERTVVRHEIEILWGDPGTRQKRIRATAARYPYLNLPFNRNIDVNGLKT